MGRNWQRSQPWLKPARLCLGCLSGPSIAVPEWRWHPRLLSGSAQPDKSRDAPPGTEWGWGGQMEGSVLSTLSPLAGCHHPDTPHSLPRECHCAACVTGWLSSESSRAGCSSTVPCCHGYLAVSPESWHQCLRGARALPHAYACARQGPGHIWASYSILVENE